jgi:Transposase DNA-binding/Transposase Tn5 dimerisation domain
MLAPWVMDEVGAVKLNDERLNRRLKLILSQLAARPIASIPAACGGNAETNAAYRFFDNDKVDFYGILQPHFDCTWLRIAAQPVVLLVNDTTEIDLTRPEQQVVNAGPLDGNSRRGAFLHAMHALTPDGTPLGTVEALPWTRDDDQPGASSQTRGERAATPIEEKESFRWLLSMRQVRAQAGRCSPTQIVYVADSEADIYEVIAEGAEEPRTADWIIRSCQNRALVDDEEERTTSDYLREELLTAPVLYEHTIAVRGREAKVACEDCGRRQPRQSREAVVEVRAARITLRAPQQKAGQLPDVTVNAVLVSEKNPPEGDVAVEWLLVTSLPIETAEQVRLIIKYYCNRWMIEVFFRTLKSGCRVEDRRFETLERQLRCLAVYLIVTWRTLLVCRLGRGCPEISCEAIFTPGEWRSVYQVVKRTQPPKEPPKLQEMVRMVAQLGGYVNKKNRADEPGPQTVWLGLQRLHDIALCWETFGPGSRGSKKAPEPEAEDV